MTDYNFTKTEPAAVSDLKRDYLAQLTSPLDGMWEAFGGMADHYGIIRDEKTIGYGALNSDQKLLQFYVEPGHDPAPIFTKFIEMLRVAGAIVSTGDPRFLSLCMDHQGAIQVNALQYHIEGDSPLKSAHFPPQTTFRPIKSDELSVAVDYAVETLGANVNWLTGYFANLIDRAELFGLWQGDALMATGECRVSESQRPYADLGMTVAQSHRKQGLATNILRQLLAHCRKRDLSPICSTERENIAAQKAIMKAGFVSDHRILDIAFDRPPS